MKKLFITLSLLIILCSFWFIRIGCENDINLETIENLIFEDINYVSIIKQLYSNSISLNTYEIDILRTAIKTGTNLVELPNDAMPDVAQENLWIISVHKKNKGITQIIYNTKTNLMFVRKSQVHSKNFKKYQQHLDLVNKYLNGVYQFQAAESINQLNKQ